MHDIGIIEENAFVHEECDHVFHRFDFSTHSQQSNLFGIEKVHEKAR